MLVLVVVVGYVRELAQLGGLLWAEQVFEDDEALVAQALQAVSEVGVVVDLERLGGEVDAALCSSITAAA